MTLILVGGWLSSDPPPCATSASWMQLVYIVSAFLKGKSRNCKASEGLCLEIAQHYFHYILLLKTILKSYQLKK